MDETSRERPTCLRFGRGSKNLRAVLKHNSPQLDILAGFNWVYRFGKWAFKGVMVQFFLILNKMSWTPLSSFSLPWFLSPAPENNPQKKGPAGSPSNGFLSP
eukprot:EG_transcript_4636